MRDRLVRRGFPVVVYQTDEIMAGRQRFGLCVDSTGQLAVTCDGLDIAPDAIAAAWYWKVAGFRVADAERNVAKQLSMVNEIAQWNSSLWGLYPERLWLSSPSAVAVANQKLLQLVTARDVGFTIPRTVVGNDWDDIEAETAPDGSDIIVKMMRGVLADQNRLKGLYTTPLDRSAIETLKESTIPFPGMFQPFLKKSREWRVTVVGDEVFPVAVHTDADARDDWRRMQNTPSVEFRVEPLPDGVADLCRAYLRRFSLRYGAFDLVEQPDGQVVFLECNPNGQHNWLEEKLGIPVADALAAELARTAEAD
ncbi:hypothetical protein ABZW47_30445 [Streptomyces sp. NPDC004549]|uniref:hypothetical protein n=1 Tax=Streptomyces sp. NPDC004549 TaxID=3154283 RepID=UPI0033A659BC